jgi:hypothetical protein
MKLIIKRDIINRKKYYMMENQYILLKAMANNKILPISFRMNIYRYLASLKPMTNKYRNICIVSGRSRGVITKFALSRLMFRQ